MPLIALLSDQDEGAEVVNRGQIEAGVKHRQLGERSHLAVATQTVAVSLEAKTVFTIANDLREMEVHGKIDEADVGQFRVGQVAQFTVDAYPDRIFSGQVTQIRKSPEVVQNVVTYTAIISAPNPDLLHFRG